MNIGENSMKKVIVLLALVSTAVFAQLLSGTAAKAQSKAAAKAEAETEAKVKAEAIRMANSGNASTGTSDKKVYKTVKIGSQTWFAENLDYGGEDGDIGTCPDNEPKNCPKYGRLYNWEDAMLACPDGWHLPSEEEWQTLMDFAGSAAGQKLKAKSGWEKWDCQYTEVDDRGRKTSKSKCNSDSYGFSALPSSSKGYYGYWWTSSESYYSVGVISMQYNSESVYKGNDNKSKAYHVRCLKGEGKLPSKFVEKKNALAVEEATKKAEKIAEAANPLTTEDTGEGTILRGSTLSKKLAWLDRSAESHNTYIIEVNANENIAPHTFEYKGAINITVILRGDEENRTIRLSSNGTMFTVKQNVTFVLDNNITLMGHNQNSGSLVYIYGGILRMNAGSAITGNMSSGSEGGGVSIRSGNLEMTGGTISNNSTVREGGGVYLNGGTFTMSGGAITGNKTTYYYNYEGGGGVFVGGAFTMTGGTISDNTAAGTGGGVSIGNITSSRGVFNMRGGIITGNTAFKNGGGVFMSEWGTFSKTGGTITGYNSDKNDGNAVKDYDGTIARRGHAIYTGEKRRKETTAGPDDNLSCDRSNSTGVWDD
jgi:uncharacterized protein (TIGR02145 family)